MTNPFPPGQPWVALEKLRDNGGGSIVLGTVDIVNVAKALGVPKSQVKKVIDGFADPSRSAAFAGVTGRKGADTGRKPSIRGALIAAYGPNARGGEVNVRAAAEGVGVHSSTIYRWLNGKSAPNPTHMTHLAAAARRAATNRAERRKAVQARRDSKDGKPTLNYGGRFAVTAYQGVEGYERDRTVYWDLKPEQVEQMWSAYENQGDAGLHAWMREYAAGDDYGNTEDWNVFTFDTISFPDS